MPSPTEIRIQRLEEEVERLRQVNEVLQRTILPKTITFPKAWRITRQETVVLRLLYRFGMVSYDAFLSALDITDPTGKHVAVIICHLRRKLAPFGVVITTHYGEGYRLSQHDKARLKDAMGAYADNQSRAASPAATQGAGDYGAVEHDCSGPVFSLPAYAVRSPQSSHAAETMQRQTATP